MSKSNKTQILTLALILLLLTVSINAEVPTLINYQGSLMDDTGAPIADGSYSATFTIYDDALAGTSYWSETQIVTTIDGSFTIFLGQVNPIHDSVFSNIPRYLGVSIEGDPEISPRFHFVSLPYAMRTASIEGASGGQLNGGLVIQPTLLANDTIAITILTPEGGLSSTIYMTQTGTSKLDFYDPVDSKGQLQVSEKKISISTEGVIIYGTTEADTVFNINSEGDVATDGLMEIGSSSGGEWSVVLGINNTAFGDTSTVGGGAGNDINDRVSTISGGIYNTISDELGTIVGGGSNSINVGGAGGCIGGGIYNVVSGQLATIGGGGWNEATAPSAIVAGGGAGSLIEMSKKNVASAVGATVGGGKKIVQTAHMQLYPEVMIMKPLQNHLLLVKQQKQLMLIHLFGQMDQLPLTQQPLIVLPPGLQTDLHCTPTRVVLRECRWQLVDQHGRRFLIEV